MAQIQKAETAVVQLNCSADKLYDLYRNNPADLTKILPESCKSFEALEGDGKSLGSVRVWKVIIGDTTDVTVTKEKITKVDDQNKELTVSVMEGDLMNNYSSLDLKLSITPKDSTAEGCLVKWSAEYVTKHQDAPPPNAIVDALGESMTALDAYLLKA